MANEIDNMRSNFFPNTTPKVEKSDIAKRSSPLKRNDQNRKSEIDKLTVFDSKVDIPSTVKDFSKIKKAVDQAPDVVNDVKIAELKSKINSGNYKIDYDALADKMLESEF